MLLRLPEQLLKALSHHLQVSHVGVHLDPEGGGVGGGVCYGTGQADGYCPVVTTHNLCQVHHALAPAVNLDVSVTLRGDCYSMDCNKDKMCTTVGHLQSVIVNRTGVTSVEHVIVKQLSAVCTLLRAPQTHAHELQDCTAC